MEEKNYSKLASAVFNQLGCIVMNHTTVHLLCAQMVAYIVIRRYKIGM